MTATTMLLAIVAGAYLAGATPDGYDVCIELNPESAGMAYAPPCRGPAGPVDTSSLTADLTLARDHHGAFSIDADGVTLDCAGYNVVGSGAVGINIENRYGVQVVNCTVWGFDEGIRLSNSAGSSIRHTTAVANDVGFHVERSTANHLEDNEALLNRVGFRLTSASDNELNRNRAERGIIGFETTLADHNEIRGNEAIGAETGIIVEGSHNALAENQVTIENQVIRGGISVDGAHNVVAGNQLANAGFLVTGSKNTFSTNVVTGAITAFGLVAATDSLFTENQAIDFDVGFDLRKGSVGNTFTDNTVSAGAVGVSGWAPTLFNTFTGPHDLDGGPPVVVTQDLTLDDHHVGAIVIDAPGVTLDCAGYNVISTTQNAALGIAINGHDNVTIRNCVVSSPGAGIVLLDVSGATLTGNQSEIVLRQSGENTIAGNVAGLISLSRKSHGNLIVDNTAESIEIRGSDRNTVTGNTIREGSLILEASDFNHVAENVLDGATGPRGGKPVAIGVRVRQAHSNVFASNNVAGYKHGFHVNGSDGNTFTGNRATCSTAGFRVFEARNNTLQGNDTTGSPLGVGLDAHCCTEGNTFTDNVGPGWQAVCSGCQGSTR